MLFNCCGCERRTRLKLPFAVACNFLKIFSIEHRVLDLCLGHKFEFRLCVLYSGGLNPHLFGQFRNCIFLQTL